MDDLDALLDDLHTTSQQYRSPDPYLGQHDHYRDKVGMSQPIYEPQNILNTTAVIETTVYKTPPSQRHSQSERYQTPPSRTYSQSSERYHTPPPYQQERYAHSEFEYHQEGGHRMSDHDGSGRVSLRSNLSELDNMLEDLNSAQFLSEVDKKSREVHSPYANLPNRPTPPPKQQETRDVRVEPPRPGASLAHVDRMLSDLERESERNRENARMGYHYEKRTVTTTQTSYNNGHPENGSRDQHTAPAGPVAPSNATRELDDLMASLSEFNMKPLAPDVPPSTGRMPGTPPISRPPAANANDPVYAVAQKGPKFEQVSRTITSTTTTTMQHTADCARSRDGSVTRFDTPVRNVVPDIQVVDSSSYANVTVDGPHRNVGNSGGQAGGTAYSEQYYVNTTRDHHDGRRDKLDDMLGQLDTDMQRHGVTTVQKGHCAACSKPIVGPVITALGKIWHPEHFCCAHCQNELGTMTFFERDGKPYCEEDYHALFSPRCAGCNGPILDRCVTGLGQTWHPEHFCCAHCGRPFDDEGFHEKEGKPYCREDYFDMFAPKCGGCMQPIIDNYISALNKQWHPECFVCQDCHMPFSGGSFFEHDGLPFCETHFHAKRGSLCAGCQKPISGRCITAMYKKFHPEHFVCAFCLKQLNKGTFKEHDDKPYCHSCFVKLFG